MMTRVPTNQQRRATARRKAERQQGRRTQARARRRRIFVITCAAIAVIGVIAAVTLVIVNEKDEKHTATTATSATAASSVDLTTTAAPTTPSLPALPAFQPQPGAGTNCQYTPTPDNKAAKAVKPPTGGKVATDDKTMNLNMVTDQGPIGLTLNINQSPCTVHSFVSLADQGFFNNTKCHRLTTSASLQVLQCGDPKGDGTGGAGYQFADEYPTNQYPPNDPRLKQPVLYPRGTLAMANAGPNTDGSQFFLVYGDSQLPPAYTVFGTISPDGLATLDKIAKAGVAGGGEDGTPATAVTIKTAQPE
jgi:peptidyl-prolyl cis-trans isomerase B (cyclophilin B)